jgi:hypothetical protein
MLKRGMECAALIRGSEPRAWFRTSPGDGAVVKVGRCRLTVSEPVLTVESAHGFSA